MTVNIFHWPNEMWCRLSPYRGPLVFITLAIIFRGAYGGAENERSTRSWRMKRRMGEEKVVPLSEEWHDHGVVPHEAHYWVSERDLRPRGLTQIRSWFCAFGKSGTGDWAAIMTAVAHGGRDTLRSSQMKAAPEILWDLTWADWSHLEQKMMLPSVMMGSSTDSRGCEVHYLKQNTTFALV